MSGRQVEGVRLIAAGHPDGAGAGFGERDREAPPAREAPAGGDRQDNGGSGQLAEGCGETITRPGSPLFLARRGVKADQPNVGALDHSSSLLTGRASSQAPSSSSAASSPHWASSSSTV